MKKIYSLFIACLFGGGLFAQHQVTFQVDMSGHSISSNGVHIAGNFQDEAGAPQDWDPAATQMTQVGTSNIYAVTVNIPAGNYEYKIINDNNWGPGEESIPAESQVSLGKGFGGGNSNRWVAVMSDTTLPAVTFGGNAPMGQTNITFVVDMGTQSTVQDTVSVAGNFQGWAPGQSVMVDLLNDSIYRYTAYVNPTDTVDFKYINGTTWAQNESVPSACNVSGNRRAIFIHDTVAGPVCFGACSACFIPDTFNITVQIDMGNVCGFNGDSLDIAGPFNGWPGGFDPAYELTDADQNGIWEITVRVPSPEFEYKVRYHDNGNTNWEGSPNNIIQFAADTTLPVRCYGNAAYNPCVPNPNPADITFMVDVSTYPTPTELNDIYLIGDFTDPQWQGGKILMTPVSGLPGVFEATVQDMCPGKINYKFLNVTTSNTELEESFVGLMDSSCTEPSGAGGLNRVFSRPDGQNYTLGFKWNRCESIVSLEENFVGTPLEIYPNPVHSTLHIDLSESNESFDIKMMDATGAVVRSLTDVNGKVSLEKGDLPAGVYILNVINEKGQINSNKIMVQ